ncbi:MAG TPA: hypothetical protein VGL53_03965 [Bryobacteraceae bacterium]|jgi:actin-like ATPase involved in cell morphogenesis
MHTNNNAMGLDVGTSRIVTAKPKTEGYEFNSQLNAFVTIPYSKLTERVLDKEGVPHSINGSQIVVHGNESEKFADLMDTEIRRPMTGGVLDAKEPESISMMREIIGSLLDKNNADKPMVCFTVPAASLDSSESLTYHEATVKQILTQLGYENRAVNEGLAVVYAELESTNYTGIGISCGGGLCNVCYSYLSVPVVTFSIPKAGDYIDANAASMTGERANRIRLAKEEAFHFNGFFSDKVQQVISVYYDDMIKSLVAGMKEAFGDARHMPKLNRAVPLVLSGGTAMPKGFRDRFEKIFNESNLPIQVSEVRMASNPLEAAAKGALVAALAEM